MARTVRNKGVQRLFCSVWIRSGNRIIVTRYATGVMCLMQDYMWELRIENIDYLIKYSVSNIYLVTSNTLERRAPWIGYCHSK